MRVYISHPIAGKGEADKVTCERAGAHYAEHTLKGSPVLPRQIRPACTQGYGDQSLPGCGIPGKVLPGDDHSVQCYMRGDLLELLTCEAMVVMPGWEHSAGCRDEVNTAAMTGIAIHFYPPTPAITKAPLKCLDCGANAVPHPFNHPVRTLPRREWI